MQLSSLQQQVLKEMGITPWVMRQQPELETTTQLNNEHTETVEVGTSVVALAEIELSQQEQQLLHQILFCLQLDNPPSLLPLSQHHTQQYVEGTTVFVFDTALSEQAVGICETQYGQQICSPSLRDMLKQPQLKVQVWQWVKQFNAKQ